MWGEATKPIELKTSGAMRLLQRCIGLKGAKGGALRAATTAWFG